MGTARGEVVVLQCTFHSHCAVADVHERLLVIANINIDKVPRSYYFYMLYITIIDRPKVRGTGSRASKLLEQTPSLVAIQPSIPQVSLLAKQIYHIGVRPA